jgi:hypothetical protein
MESTNAILNNNTTYTNSIRAYFYTNQGYSYKTYNMVIVCYDDNWINVTNRKSFQVLINFVPEDFVEYDFDVIEATSSYLHLKMFSNDYTVNFITESSEVNNGENVFDYEPAPEHLNMQTKNTNETNIIDSQETKILNSDNQMDFHDEEYNYTYGYDSADDYDSEGYYFRVK